MEVFGEQQHIHQTEQHTLQTEVHMDHSVIEHHIMVVVNQIWEEVMMVVAAVVVVVKMIELERNHWPELAKMRCACCKVFGHIQKECPKNIGSGEVKNLKKPCQHTANTSGNKKKDVEPTKKVSNSNSFEVLNSVENDVDLGTNGGTSNLASKEANHSGSSFWNVKTSSTSTTPIVDKIRKLEELIIDGKVTFVDDEGKPLKKIDYPGDHDSEDEVESVDNYMTVLWLQRVGFGTNSLLEQ
ncbi:high affinity nitrate transporter 2.4-like protein [Tanacetum coccineum]